MGVRAELSLYTTWVKWSQTPLQHIVDSLVCCCNGVTVSCLSVTVKLSTQHCDPRLQLSASSLRHLKAIAQTHWISCSFFSCFPILRNHKIWLKDYVKGPLSPGFQKETRVPRGVSFSTEQFLAREEWEGMISWALERNRFLPDLQRNGINCRAQRVVTQMAKSKSTGIHHGPCCVISYVMKKLEKQRIPKKTEHLVMVHNVPKRFSG